MKFGIYEKAINNKFSWLEKIKIAKKAGFDFIEISIDESDARIARLDWTNQEINELKQNLVDHNFHINSMCLSAHRKYPFGSQDRSTRNMAIEIIEKAILLCKALNIPIIQLAGYDVYYEESNEITRKNFEIGIKQAAQLASHHSIMLAFEIMDTAFMGTIIKGMHYVNLVGSPWLNLYPDIGNLSQYSKNPEFEIEQNIKNIVAFHSKDTLANQFRDLNFGDGNVDFLSIFKTLKKVNWNGPIVFEMWSKNDLNETMEENIEKLIKAKTFNFSKMKEAGINVKL